MPFDASRNTLIDLICPVLITANINSNNTTYISLETEKLQIIVYVFQKNEIKWKWLPSKWKWNHMKSKEEKLNQFGKTVEFSKSADFHKG